jgi:hypothetical protein
MQALMNDATHQSIPRPAAFTQILPWDIALEEGLSTERYSFHPFYGGKHVQLIIQQQYAYIWSSEQVLLTDVPKVIQQWAQWQDDIHLEAMFIEKHVPAALKQSEDKEEACLILLENQHSKIDRSSLPPFIHSLQLEIPDWREVIHYCNSLPNHGVQALLVYDKITHQLFLKKPQRKLVHAYLLYARKDKYGAFDEFSLGWKKGNDFLTMLRVQNTLEPGSAKEITEWIMQNTTERFGPVHMVTPQIVFEVSYESISTSSRHKSGMILNATKLIGRVEEPDEMLIGKLS